MTSVVDEAEVEADVEFEDDINDRGVYVINEVTTLLGTDWPESLAQRLDYPSAAALSDGLKRWGRYDLAARLNRVEWDGLVTDSHRTVNDRRKGAWW